jgi:class 3 adenylate cyclase/tetratricopeptide (TPR) repeat protein
VIACDRCGASNPDDARFCVECGSRFGSTCPACGAELGGPVRFCPSCGASISATAAEEQRKVVSVLFVDLVGHTSRSDGADPEDVRDILREYYRVVRGTIERFGGVVEKFIGDAVMAVFGTPVASGDDAERAVGAALAIPGIIQDLNRSSEFPDLEVHVAVNTGEAVVTIDPTSADGSVLVAGDVVNTAARLQSAAPPGTVLVGEETHRAIRRSIRCEPTDPVIAKGKREPIAAWIAVEVLSSFADRPAVLTFVGRDAELGLLRNVWDRVVGEHRPHLVTILGEPGIGKTRLADELAGDVRASGGGTFSVRELPYEQSSGFEAFAQLVRQVAGIFESDQSSVAQTKLTDALDRLGLTDPEVIHLLSVFARSTEAAAEDRRSLFDAARMFVEAIAADRPTLIAFDDIHWAHPSTLDLLTSLSSRASDAPVMLLALSRPELLDLRPTWGGGLSSATTIALEPLPAGAAHWLVAGLVEDQDPGVAERIETTAGGNPLFIEELAAWMTEGGRDVDALPTTVRAMIAARLDALPREERHVLFDASVIGMAFWVGPLASLGVGDDALPDILDSLERRDLIRPVRTSAVEGDKEYRFRHMLIRDTAYATLPRKARRERHESVARYIEGAAHDVSSFAAILAHHWLEAGDAELAIGYLRTAAELAEKRWAYPEAVELYEEALSLIPKDDQGRRRAIGLRRTVAGVRYEHAVMEEEQLKRLSDEDDEPVSDAGAAGSRPA